MSSQHVTASFCRQQEAVHREKAASEPLENRRKIALSAAKAWAAEALMLERHEAGQAPLDKLDAEITLEFAREAADAAGEQSTVPEFPLLDGS